VRERPLSKRAQGLNVPLCRCAAAAVLGVVLAAVVGSMQGGGSEVAEGGHRSQGHRREWQGGRPQQWSGGRGGENGRAGTADRVGAGATRGEWADGAGEWGVGSCGLREVDRGRRALGGSLEGGCRHQGVCGDAEGSGRGGWIRYGETGSGARRRHKVLGSVRGRAKGRRQGLGCG
jgi:hypothetical protein